MTTLTLSRRSRALRHLAGLACLGLLWLTSTLSTGAKAAELLMFEQRGCPFCAKFDSEIAPDYPRSAAGLLAPLRHVDIYESRNGGIANLEPAVFTPTFVLVEQGREVGRLVGYPGRRYFYGEIQRLIDRLASARSTIPK